MSEAAKSANNDSATITAYKLARDAAGGFDSILVTLLTQGNTFVIAILSVPLVASLDSHSTAWLMGFALLLSMFLFLANYLYWNLLKRAVRIAEKLESEHLRHLPETHHLTRQFDRIPLSANRGSMVLYLFLPPIWSLSAIFLGWRAMSKISDQIGFTYLLLSTLLVLIALVGFLIFIRRPLTPQITQ